MRELVVATGNNGKIKELTALLAGVVDRILAPGDLSAFPDVVEDGATFEENAVKKARQAALATGLPALADDSGLTVDALGGRPGILSARFAGERASDTDNNALLMREMAGIPPAERTAAFRCVLALCYPDGTCHTFDGHLSGLLLEEMRGGGGFGYDPLFLVPEYGLTLAELPMEVKNRISHRGKALKQLLRFLHS